MNQLFSKELSFRRRLSLPHHNMYSQASLSFSFFLAGGAHGATPLLQFSDDSDSE